MKSKYSSNRGDYLYRAYALKSKKKKKAFGNLPKVIVTVFFFVLAGFLFVFGGGYFLSHSPLFSVKKVAVSVANEKTIPD
ncbi:MAG: hypothetical protein PHW02_03175, partial [bacterium]|nr:hypothetical protein [bacterium]